MPAIKSPPCRPARQSYLRAHEAPPKIPLTSLQLRLAALRADYAHTFLCAQCGLEWPDTMHAGHTGRLHYCALCAPCLRSDTTTNFLSA